MFERIKINAAIELVCSELPVSNEERKYIVNALVHSPFKQAAVTGVKKGLLLSPTVAVAYLSAAIVQTTAHSDEPDDERRGAIADQAAMVAMTNAGATEIEARTVFEEMVAIHERSEQRIRR